MDVLLIYPRIEISFATLLGMGEVFCNKPPPRYTLQTL